MRRTFELEVAGRTLSLETGRLAKQADGAVLARYGETVLLVTSVMNENPREGLDFFPLLVDYEERFYSAGKIPGGFIKREGRPSETAILSARVVDRSIRSLFPDGMRNDVHVVATVLSVDQSNSPSLLAVNAASAALALSGIPWNGPIAAVRIGHIDGEFVVNPTEEQIGSSVLDLTVSGHRGGITMVEAGAQEVSEELLVDALDLAQREIVRIVEFIEGIRNEAGKPMRAFPEPVRFPEIDDWIARELGDEIYRAIQIHAKQERAAAVSELAGRAKAQFAELYPDCGRYVASVVEEHVQRGLRRLILDEGKRTDGRAMDELRPITCETDILPKTHGSALFTRGETQALVVTTLGMMGEDDQVLDGLKHDEPSKRFILHYNFPPYSVGEVRPMRGPGRREIGHGALAERALMPMIPSESEFPYVMRVVSDILESNGSSSMASVCGGSMSLMDAGVPIRKAVAGVAMGLIAEEGKFGVLTDIQGLEDHYGDMDFKVAGTRDGVTALQMDNKAGGITREVLQRALGQAKKGRMQILDKMEAAIASSRAEISPNAPRILTLQIDPEKIREVIGPGGKMIRSIVQQTGAKIDVEDDGRVYIAGLTDEAAQAAQKIIRDLTRDVEAGEIFVGRVTRGISFGFFVEVLPGKEGLLHASEISTFRIPNLEDAFKVGDSVLVMVKEIDDMKRVNLTRRRLLEKAAELEGNPEFAPQLAVEREREVRFEAMKGEPGSRPASPRGDRPERGDRPFRGDRGGDRPFRGDRGGDRGGRAPR